MSEHLEAAQTRAREAHNRLAEATAAHTAELERIRQEADEAIASAAKADEAIQQARAGAAARGRGRGSEGRRRAGR